MGREEIINEIKNYISVYKSFICPDYPELNIFTSQYLDVLIKYYNNAQKDYCVIYADVNKLSIVNDKYGKEVGDKVLYTLLNIFTSTFKGRPTVRIGGDEFVMFVSNQTKQEIEENLKIPDLTMIHGSSMEFGVEDSSAGTAEEIINIAEQKVNEKKRKNKDFSLMENTDSKGVLELSIPEGISKEQKEKWKILNEKINILVYNHLRDVRPSNVRFEYLPEHIKKDSKSFISAFADLLKKHDKKIQSNDKEINKEEKDDTISCNSYSNMTNKSAYIMHSMFKGEDVDLNALTIEELNNIKESLESLGNTVIKNKHSGLFGKTYYKLFLADKLLESKQTYQAIYLSMSGIRPSNTAYGHMITDEKIEKTSKILIDEIKNKRDFNSNPFSFNRNDIFFIDQGGGNFLLLLPKNKKLKDKQMQEIVSKVNSQSTEDTYSNLKIAYAIKNGVNKRNIQFFINSMAGNPKSLAEWFRTLNQIIKNKKQKTKLLEQSGGSIDKTENNPFVKLSYRLKQDCNNNKDAIKVENLDKNISKASIEAIAKDCVSYFYNEIEDANSIIAQKLLLENLMISLANHESHINEVNKKTLENRLQERKIFNKKQNKMEKDER